MRGLERGPSSAGKAGPPFDGLSGDIVIRSSDGIDFHMSQAHLTAASEVLKQILSSATANEGELVPIIPIYKPIPVIPHIPSVLYIYGCTPL